MNLILFNYNINGSDWIKVVSLEDIVEILVDGVGQNLVVQIV